MERRHRSPAAALMVAGLTFAAMQPATAQDEVPGLIDLLRLMPASERLADARELFSYVDFRAVEKAGGLPLADMEVAERVPQADAFADWPAGQRSRWLQGMQRVVTGPGELRYHMLQVGRTETPMEVATGVDYFAIDRAMEFGKIVVMSGDAPIVVPDMQRLSLPRRGFVLREVGGIPVWHRFQDDALASALSDDYVEADPFSGHAMLAVRLAVLPDTLILTRNWADMEAVLAVHSDEVEPAPTVPLLERMVAATLTLDDVGDRVLQAWASPVFSLTAMDGAVDQMLPMFTDPDGALPDPEALEGAVDATRPIGDPLPLYPFALFVDLQAGQDQVNAIALPYADREQAEAAAQVLADRLRMWMPRLGPEDQPIVAALRGTVESVVVDAPDVATDLALAYMALGAQADRPLTPDEIRERTAGIDGAIAVVAVRYPMPGDTGEPLGPTPGLLIGMWVNGIQERSFSLLSVP